MICYHCKRTITRALRRFEGRGYCYIPYAGKRRYWCAECNLDEIVDAEAPPEPKLPPEPSKARTSNQ